MGQFVDVSVRSREMHVYHQNKRVALHERSYRPHDWVIDIEHYLDTFKRKPGALAGSQALAGNHYLRDLYINLFRDEPREFIELLAYCRDRMVSGEKLEESVKRLLGSRARSITVEQLRALLGNEPLVVPAMEPGDNITARAKEQLSRITGLMHETSNNGHYQQANNRI